MHIFWQNMLFKIGEKVVILQRKKGEKIIILKFSVIRF